MVFRNPPDMQAPASPPPPKDGRGQCLRISEIAEAFNEWMRLFTEDPTKFEHEWQTVDRFLTETMSGREPSYGDVSAAFLLQLVGKEPKSDRVQPDHAITLTYTNWRGETAERTIIPRHVWFGATQWHPEPQWLLAAIDVENGAERDFALLGFGSGPAVNRIAALNAQIDALRARVAELEAAK